MMFIFIVIALPRMGITFKAVETFYRRYYFRPRYIWKSIKKMATSREEAKRLQAKARAAFVDL